MRRPLFTSFLTGSLAFGVLPVVLATTAHAQAPSRPAAAWYYDYAPPPPPPARARTSQPSADSDYRSASLAPVTSGGYYPVQRPAAARARDYYAPAAGYPARTVPSIRVAPVPSRARPSLQPAADDDYAYKS